VALLTEGMLDELAARWREQGAAVADDLRPGLPEDEVRSAAEAVGLTLPAEVLVWWGWHDGTGSLTAKSALGLDLLYLPMASAFRLYETERRNAALVADGSDPLSQDDVWPRAWLPLSTKGAGMMMVCDCGVAEGGPTPIRHVDHEFFDRSHTPVADSLGTAVGWWIDAIDRGAWSYNRERGHWERFPDRLTDPGLASTGLV
jgi:hypothetical protein